MYEKEFEIVLGTYVSLVLFPIFLNIFLQYTIEESCTFHMLKWPNY